MTLGIYRYDLNDVIMIWLRCPQLNLAVSADRGVRTMLVSEGN